MSYKTTLSLAVCLLMATLAHASIVYTWDFEGGEDLSAFSGVVSVEGTQGFSAYGFGDSFLRNSSTGNPASSTTLTLTGLPEHTAVIIQYDFCAIESWDGRPGEPASYNRPDYFNMTVDGNTHFSDCFLRASPGAQDPSWEALTAIAEDDPRVIILGEQLMRTHYDPEPYFESAYRMGENELISHSGDTLTINWFAGGSGWQGGNDESWAIDNIKVTIVPEPATLSLLAMAGVAMLRRRK